MRVYRYCLYADSADSCLLSYLPLTRVLLLRCVFAEADEIDGVRVEVSFPASEGDEMENG